jgi:GDP-4-dehydro-6-deoxy-D-mannose reductase
VRALVTGAGGFVGQHLIRELLGAGAQIVGGVLAGRPPRDGVLRADELARVRWTSLDVTDPASLHEAVAGSAPDRVYHLAGQASVGGSFADPIGTWDVNATGTLRLLEALRTHGAKGARVLVVSSAEVYGAVPESRQPIGEDEPLRPITPYGASKMAAEAAALQAAAARELHVVVARSFNHAGPGQDERFALPSMARQLVEFERGGDDEDGGATGAALRVGNLEPLRDFLDVRDVARAYAMLVERGESGGIYNVASGRARPMMEIVQALVRASGTGAGIDADPDRFRPVDIPLLVGDASRLRALGWSPEIPLERTLRDLLDSVRALDPEPRRAGGAAARR